MTTFEKRYVKHAWIVVDRGGVWSRALTLRGSGKRVCTGIVLVDRRHHVSHHCYTRSTILSLARLRYRTSDSEKRDK